MSNDLYGWLFSDSRLAVLEPGACDVSALTAYGQAIEAVKTAAAHLPGLTLNAHPIDPVRDQEGRLIPLMCILAPRSCLWLDFVTTPGIPAVRWRQWLQWIDALPGHCQVIALLPPGIDRLAIRVAGTELIKANGQRFDFIAHAPARPAVPGPVLAIAPDPDIADIRPKASAH